MERRADTRWFPWRHRAAFDRVGPAGVLLLVVFVQPQTYRHADLVCGTIEHLRYLRSRWLVHAGASWFDRRFLRESIFEMNYGLTPWTTPTIHDVGDVLEVLLRSVASRVLVNAMGETLHSWYEDLARPRSNSDFSSDSE